MFEILTLTPPVVISGYALSEIFILRMLKHVHFLDVLKTISTFVFVHGKLISFIIL
jgi:hypothetical protein